MRERDWEEIKDTVSIVARIITVDQGASLSNDYFRSEPCLEAGDFEVTTNVMAFLQSASLFLSCANFTMLLEGLEK